MTDGKLRRSRQSFEPEPFEFERGNPLERVSTDPCRGRRGRRFREGVHGRPSSADAPPDTGVKVHAPVVSLVDLDLAFPVHLHVEQHRKHQKEAPDEKEDQAERRRHEE